MLLTETQILLLEKLSREKILERIKQAQWHIVHQKEQNGTAIYFIIDRHFRCSCGNEKVHHHSDGLACCALQKCCQLEKCPEEDFDYDLMIAQKVGILREMFKQRNGE